MISVAKFFHKIVFLLLITVFCWVEPVFSGVFSLDAEVALISQSRNDVQIPASTGTRFSLSDLQEGPSFSYRLYSRYNWGESSQHEIRLLWAPLQITVQGSAAVDIVFQDETFSSGAALTGRYTFNSYRASYIYKFHDSESFWARIGFTGKIRDAGIRLSSGLQSAERDNVGFVPLLHFSAAWKFSVDSRLLLDIDALAAPQGRAEDILLAYEQSFDGFIKSSRVGYRMVEGGADGGGNVYNFAWIHYAIFSVHF